MPKRSNTGGPPPKVIKYEMESQFLEGEVTDEGQEEWLSEGILTDDDCNPMTDQTQDSANADHSSQEEDQETLYSADDRDIPQDDDTRTTTGSNEGTQEMAQNSSRESPSLAEALSHSLIPSLQLNDPQNSQTFTQNSETFTQDSETGNNDTADSNRTEYSETVNEKAGDSREKMGDSGNNTSAGTEGNIEETLNQFEQSREDSRTPDLPDDLDAYLIRRAQPIKPPSPPPTESKDDGNDTDDLLRMLGEADNNGKKKQLTRKATKAVHSNASSDDDEYIYTGKTTAAKNLQAAKTALARKPATKATPEPDVSDDEPLAKMTDNAKLLKRMSPSIKVNIVKNVPVKVQKSHPIKVANEPTPFQQQNKILHSALANANATKRPQPTNAQPKVNNSNNQIKSTNKSLLKSQPASPIGGVGEFSKDKPTNKSQPKQSIMKPEVMDEVILSEDESGSDHDSLYDELPSSDSEGLDDWFGLDIRAERAGDYLPILGDEAQKLLLEEKQRVQSRLTSLKSSLTLLTDSAKKQAEELKLATIKVAELDALLKAT